MRDSYARLQRLIVSDSQCADAQPSTAKILLTEQQRHYLYRVLRLQAGDRFIAVMSDGWWLAELQQNEPSARMLQIIPVQTELPVAVTLLMALPKNGMDDVVRQATELGITQIQPVLSQRTLLHPSSQKLDRWRRIAQEAAEQSERQFVPELLPPLLWQEALQTWNATQATCYLCEARGDYPHLLTCLLNSVNDGERLEPSHLTQDVNKAARQEASEGLADTGGESPMLLVIAVGAEGGWTSTEIEQAITAGYQPVTLGARILRSITAPLVALSVIASVLEARQNQQARKNR